MQEKVKYYRFNLKKWMTALPLKNRSIIMDKIINNSGQSKATVKRITYMDIDNQTYVRTETKEAICKLFGKSINDFENKSNQDAQR